MAFAVPVEEKSIHANEIKEAIKNLKDQSEHHAEIIKNFDDEIDSWWGELQKAWCDLKIEGKRVKGVRQYQPKDVIESHQRIGCLEWWRQDEVIKLQKTKDKIEHITKYPQLYHPTAIKASVCQPF